MFTSLEAKARIRLFAVIEHEGSVQTLPLMSYPEVKELI